VTRPVKELKYFRKISLIPDESRRVDFTIIPEMLTYLESNLKSTVDPGQLIVMLDPSSRDRDLRITY